MAFEPDRDQINLDSLKQKCLQMTFPASSFQRVCFSEFMALIYQSALASAACALARSIEPIETISMEPRTFSEGTVIIVATRR